MIADNCANQQFFYATYHWLAFGSTVDVIEKFRNVSLAINTDLNVAVPNNENANVKNWTIYDVYNPSYNHGGNLKILDIGYYNEQEGYHVVLKDTKYYRRRNMTGTLFRSAVVIPENITISLDEYLASEKEHFNNSSPRFQSITIRNCQDFFNFKMNVTIVHSWGYEQSDGEVDGLVKELKYKKVDFGLAPLLFQLYRLKVIDFGYGNWIYKSVFIFRHPKSTATSYELYLRPLVTSVWISTLATTLLMTIILRLTVTKENKVLDTTTSGGENSWSFLLLYGIGEICQQGFSYVPVLPSGRIVIFIVLLFSFLIYQFYTASVVSFLLMEPPRTIVTLLDLLKSPLEAGCEDLLIHKDYIAKTKDPVAIKLYNTKIKHSYNKSDFLTPDEGLRKVEAGGYAFHTQTSSAYPIIGRTFEEKSICELAEVEMYPTQPMYLGVQKRSPFRDMFNYCLIHQREVGIIDRLRKYWDAPKPVCLDATNYFEITVGLDESYWALLLLGFGIITSLVIFGIEHIWVRNKNAIKYMGCRKRKLRALAPFVDK
ncbi:hypothetical protein ILUMI_21687 [Ignelater luminosus]|uniref:Uncharacterized protein n=1 Tax=Ignelater luminosus TaxID=2038154 RepID=A0A8K0G3B9_IGNLU|nr:hypothetical protein ILUMI_21687 [Ignelater luminosus]